MDVGICEICSGPSHTPRGPCGSCEARITLRDVGRTIYRNFRVDEVNNSCECLVKDGKVYCVRMVDIRRSKCW